MTTLFYHRAFTIDLFALPGITRNSLTSAQVQSVDKYGEPRPTAQVLALE